MLQNANPAALAQIDRLAAEMEAGNAALILFDGAVFAKHVLEEVRLCAELKLDPGGNGRPCALPQRLRQALVERRELLASTQRTVRALSAIAGCAPLTYDSQQIRSY